MSPTIAQPAIVAGSPGGSRIITITLGVLQNIIDYGMNVKDAVDAPRVHHQWLPDEISIEPGALDARRGRHSKRSVTRSPNTRPGARPKRSRSIRERTSCSVRTTGAGRRDRRRAIKPDRSIGNSDNSTAHAAVPEDGSGQAHWPCPRTRPAYTLMTATLAT
jgi:hypothetical protein